MKKVAFIPARSGSKRIPHKNIKLLNNHPLIAYAIRSALDSKIFNDVICITDSEEYAEIALSYGASVPFLRPEGISKDASPDIEWVSWILELLKQNDLHYDIFSILRPTSPFRNADTIKRAWEQFKKNEKVDSLRAVEKCSQHPGKMWILNDNTMQPLYPFSINNTPWHSNQYNVLPEIFVQNASLEIAWTKTIYDKKSISGNIIYPFITQGLEGFDINKEEDWLLAEIYTEKNKTILPKI